jgi:hypothetical protein
MSPWHQALGTALDVDPSNNGLTAALYEIKERDLPPARLLIVDT